MPNTPKPLPKLPLKDTRAPDLVVCRESSLYNNLLMDGMIAQTLGNLRHLPGVEDVLAAGITPLTGGSPFRTFPFRRHRTNAVLFEHCGVIYLYSLGSAATANIRNEENAFVELLVDVVTEYQPLRTHVATFSRLIRSTEFSGKLQGAVKRHVDEVWCGSTLIQPRTAEGKMMWAVLSLVADMERDLINQRLFAGKCTAYLRGDWVFGEASVPPGYILGDDKRVHVDPAQIEMTRVLLNMMSDPDFTSRQIVDEVGQLGMSSPTVRRLHGPSATYEDLRRADSRLSGIIDWIPTYRTGVIEIFHRNAFPGAPRVAGLEVLNSSDLDPGQVCFRYEVGLPEGGWVDDSVLTAAVALRRGLKDRRKTGGAMHQKRKPLAGTTWMQDGVEHRISGTSRHYEVRRATPLAETDEVG
jgi:hypothetical protein